MLNYKENFKLLSGSFLGIITNQHWSNQTIPKYEKKCSAFTNHVFFSPVSFLQVSFKERPLLVPDSASPVWNITLNSWVAWKPVAPQAASHFGILRTSALSVQLNQTSFDRDEPIFTGWFCKTFNWEQKKTLRGI